MTRATQFREPLKTARLNAWYRKRLRAVAKAVGQIAAEFRDETDPVIATAQIQLRLFNYSQTLQAWATEVANIMVTRASDADWLVWKDTSKKLGEQTLKMLKDKNVGGVYERMMYEQVELIKSIPLEASSKVVQWCRTGLANGDRWSDITNRIQQELPGVTKRRADCIARTETARARSNFTQARAEAVGSKKYIWHTVGDGAVRTMHAKLDGTTQEWDKPPLCDKPNIHAHPGQTFNCRCFAEPLWEDEE